MILVLLSVVLLTLIAVRFTLGKRIQPRSSGIWAVLGSGGHTNEMMRLIDSLSPHLRPSTFISGTDDALSVQKASSMYKPAMLKVVSRPRAVGQSYFTSILTTLKAFHECLLVMTQEVPKLVTLSVFYSQLILIR